LTFSDSGKFLCNICGTECERPPEGIDREGPSCPVCNSSSRVRALISLLSEELLGVSMPLSEFPRLKGICGIGMSDQPELAEWLAKKLDYTNTFYHQAPWFDVTLPDPNDFGRYDFILSSEVMEHVPPPVEQSFTNLFRLLKPEGLLIMTTPYSLGGKTKEHFPELYHFSLAALRDETVLVNRRRDGTIEVFDNLIFHGGEGSTVEMREFSEGSLREQLLGAGFSSVRVAFEDLPEFGVELAEKWSLPIAARKGKFHPPVAELAREYRSARRLAMHLEKELAKLKGDYARYVAHHEEWSKEMDDEMERRLEWGAELDRKMIERTEWAQSLDREIAALQARLEVVQAEKDRLQRSKWTRLGRKIGAVR
jgi:SAM-dependent methyltransferase